MSSLNSLYLKKETLETLLQTISKKKENGVELTVSISDTKNEYGQNVSAYVSQSEDQRKAKTKRYYVGNGKTFWSSDNSMVKPKEKIEKDPFEEPPMGEKVGRGGINDNGDLPF